MAPHRAEHYGEPTTLGEIADGLGPEQDPASLLMYCTTYRKVRSDPLVAHLIRLLSSFGPSSSMAAMRHPSLADRAEEREEEEEEEE